MDEELVLLVKASVDLFRRTSRSMDEINRTLIEVYATCYRKQGGGNVSDVNPSSV